MSATVTPLTLTSVDGIALDASLHRPIVEKQGLGAVVLAHGLTSDLDDDGKFIQLALKLAREGFSVLRFSFRGHGKSGGTQRGVTIAGEMLDLEAAIEIASAGPWGPLSLVAASFGAVSTTLSLPWLQDRLRALTLWNPVLDLRRTFLEPELPWGLENFNPAARERLRREGHLLVDEEFELGRAVFEEFEAHDPGAHLAASTVPTLIVHGDHDSYVSYEIARTIAEKRPGSDFHTVTGADHGFNSAKHEDDAIHATVKWLTRQHLMQR
jgi:alpha-beta hydrolase superfamily lysophospholipase